MRALRVFKDWTGSGKQLGFYTKFTSDQIPAVEGCYAFFLPLWIYRKNLGDFLEALNRVMHYEPVSERSASVPFNWESIELKARRDVKARAVDPRDLATWDRLVADDVGRDALERVLIEASVLMPPLYVGRAKNLQRRYVQHTRGGPFHERFQECVQEAVLPLSVSDLLFVCIKTAGQFENVAASTDRLESLLETILMQTCRPPFSLK